MALHDDVTDGNAYSQTDPGKLESLSIQELHACYEALSRLYPRMDALGKGQYLRRIETVRREIEMRRIEERGERHHRELFGKAKWTLFWAAIGGVTGIALVLLAVWPLVHDTFFSTTQPASAPHSMLTTPLQSQSPTSAGLEPATSSNISTASPEPTAATTPLPPTPARSREYH